MPEINSQFIESKIPEIYFQDGTNLSERLSDVIIKENGNIGFSFDITNIDIKDANDIRDKITNILSEIDGIDKIAIVFTRNSDNKTSENNTEKKNTHKSKNANLKSKICIEKVKKVIIITSCKGGVGKSTMTSLIATKLTSMGHKIGILDADIYGPSIPHIFGINQKPIIENNRMIPFFKHGIYINSMGLLVEENTAISWRGPMISKALYQLISLTEWEDLDYLLIDTPPGTGDIHLSILQNYLIDDVIIVTTPQKISTIDVERSINLYRKFDANITGIVENMSNKKSTNNINIANHTTNSHINLFSGNGADETAKKYNIPVIANVPILPELAYNCDNAAPLNEFTQYFNEIEQYFKTENC